MVTKNKLERLKRDLLQKTPENKDHNYKKKLINKLNNIAAGQENTERLYYDDKLAELKESLEAESDQVKCKVWKSIIKIIEESDKQEYNRKVKKHNEEL